MSDPRQTASAMFAREDGDRFLVREVRRLRQVVQVLIVTQAVTLLGVLALAAAVERRSKGLKDAVWDAAEKAERAAREELPGAVGKATARIQEFEARLQTIDEQARSVRTSLGPGGEVEQEAKRLAEDLKRGVRDAVRDSVRREVAAALERERAAAAATTATAGP